MVLKSHAGDVLTNQFFFQALVDNVVQLCGPVRQVSENTKYFSGIAPRRLSRERGPLPHVTIQCPVYKEGLEGVISPTVKSIKAAISTYELQGGSANMFFNDDGLQLISEEERNERIDFYTDHNIGWTARPKHGSEGFLRRGKFKKASNMNFGLMISNIVEEKLAGVDRPLGWTQAEEAREYERCLNEVLDENGRAWADGNIRIGDYIVLSKLQGGSDCLITALT